MSSLLVIVRGRDYSDRRVSEVPALESLNVGCFLPTAARGFFDGCWFFKMYLFSLWLCWVFIAAPRFFSTCRERGLL